MAGRAGDESGGQTPQRRQPRQERSRFLVDAIIEATARVVSEHGPSGATTNRIADVAGVSIGSLYQYFPNKRALVEEVRERHDASFERRIVAELPSVLQLPLRGALRRLTELMVNLHVEELALHNALAGETEGAEFREKIHDLEGEWLPAAVAYLESQRDELRPTDLDLAARMALRTLETLTHDVAIDQPELLGREDYADELTELLFRFLAK